MASRIFACLRVIQARQGSSGDVVVAAPCRRWGWSAMHVQRLEDEGESMGSLPESRFAPLKAAEWAL
jgi:hypothetical protein